MGLVLKKKGAPCNSNNKQLGGGNGERRRKKRKKGKWKTKEETLSNIFHLLLRATVFDNVFWS